MLTATRHEAAGHCSYVRGLASGVVLVAHVRVASHHKSSSRSCAAAGARVRFIRPSANIGNSSCCCSSEAMLGAMRWCSGRYCPTELSTVSGSAVCFKRSTWERLMEDRSRSSPLFLNAHLCWRSSLEVFVIRASTRG